MNRNALLFAAVAALLAGGLLHLYLARVETELSGGEKIAVLALVRPLESGATLTADALAVRQVPLAYVEERAIRETQRARVVGLTVAGKLAAQQTLLWSDLAIAGNERRDLSTLIRPGRRGLAIRANGGQSFSLIHPGDYVDVIGELTDKEGHPRSVVLLQRILVLAVGDETDAKATRQGSREQTLTLSVRLEDAQLVTLAAEQGSLSVVLRNAEDQELLLELPDVPATALLDEQARELVQRRAAAGNLPVRLETVQ